MRWLPKFTWDVDPVIFHYPGWLSFLPGDGLRYYSVLYICVFLGAYELFEWQIRRAGGSARDAGAFFIYAVVATVVGSRVGHIVFYGWREFVADPATVLNLGQIGISSHGGTVGLLLAMWLFTKRRGQSFLEGADRFTYSAALAATLIRIGNWFNSEIVGRKTDQSWGVYFPRFDRHSIEPVYRHPTQLYEVALGIVVLACLWIFDQKLGEERRPRGFMISLLFATYFTGRFLVEFWKEPQSWAAGTLPLTEGQFLSILPAALGWYGLHWSLKRRISACWFRSGDDVRSPRP
jgi:phosphatidylglycerol:prolipoprotein diacylglycerol transferase